MDAADAPDEIVLCARARSGDRDAWARLCRIHAPRLAAYLGARLHRPAIVERLVCDAIVVAWDQLGTLDEDGQFPAWFRRVGAQLALRWHEENPEEKLREPFPEQLCHDAQQLERMRALQEALRALPAAERMALEQRFRGGLTGAVLGESLHCDAAAAEQLVDRALQALARALEP